MLERYISTERGNVYYWINEEIDNSKKTIFFFHGLTANHTMFNDQMEFFKEEYNVIAWDAPCQGKSRGYKNFNFDNSTEDIISILNENKISKIIAVGQSFGGYFVQALIKRNKSVVSQFVAIGTSPYGEKYYSSLDKFILRRFGFISSCYSFQSLKHKAAKSATYTNKGYENMLEMTKCYKKLEFSSVIQNLYDAFLEDNCDLNINCPVLIMYGKYDKAGKVKKYSNEWAREENYRLVEIPNAGHNANVDNPEVVNKEINNFVINNSQ